MGTKLLWIFAALCCLASIARAAAAGDSCSSFLPSKACGEDGCDCYQDENGVTHKTNTCFQERLQRCEHGACRDGICACHGCWSGPACDVPVNEHAPRFDRNQQEVNLPKDAVGPVFKLNAYDADLEKCAENEPCECAEIHYAIVAGDRLGRFDIHSTNGQVLVEGSNFDSHPEEALLIVEARNQMNPEKVSHINVTVRFVDDMDYDDNAKNVGRRLMSVADDSTVDAANVPHHRSKRSTGNPTAMTFTLEKTGSTVGKTDVKVGDKLYFSLTIWMPVVTTDMRIEMYTSKESTAILTICDPVVSTVGSNFPDLDKETVVSTLEAKALDGRPDRAVLIFPEIVNNGADTTNPSANQIVVTFCALAQNHIVDAESYYVSAGAEHGNKVWVGQSAFTGVADSITSPTNAPPVFSLTGPSTLMKGKAGLWTLDMTFYDAANDVILDVYAPLDTTNILSICTVAIGERGAGYGCLQDDSATFTKTSLDSFNNVNIATFNLGSIVNAMFREGNTDAAANTLKIEIVASMLDTAEAVTGTQYYLGTSVEIDTAAIWSAQLAFSPEDFALTTPDVLPVYSIESAHASLPWGAATSFFVNLTLPESTVDEYQLELALPYSTGAVMTACDAKIVYVGHNFACFDQSAVAPAVFSSTDSNGENDYVTYDLGRIANSGARSDELSNTIIVQIDAKMVASHGSVSAGDSVSVTAGLGYGGNMVWVGSTSLTVLANSVQPTDVPQFKLTSLLNYRDQKFLYDHGQNAFYLEMYLPGGNVWPSITIEITTPQDVDGRPQLELCSVKKTFHGSSIPGSCLADTYWDFTFTSNTLPEDDPYQILTDNYKASLTVTDLSGAGAQDWWHSRNASTIGFTFVVIKNDNVNLTIGEKYWTDILVDFGGSGTFTGKVAVEPTDAVPALADIDDPLEIELTRANVDGSVYKGGIAVYDLAMYLTPRTVLPFVVEASVPADSLSVCRVEISSRGSDVESCTADDLDPQYVCIDGDGMHDSAIYNIGNTIAYGQEKRTVDNRQNSRLNVQIVVQVHPNAPVTQGTGYPLTTTVTVDGTQYNTNTSSVVAEVNSVYVMTQQPVISLNTGNHGVNTVTRGAATILKINMYIPAASTADYLIEFFAHTSDADIGKASLGPVHIVTAGYNVPCINDTYMTRNYSLSSDNVTNNIATLEAGFIANMADSTDLETAPNLVTAECVLWVPYNGPAANGDVLQVSAAVSINTNQIFTTTLDLTIQDAIFAEETNSNAPLKLGMTDTAQDSDIGKLTTWTVNITASTWTTWNAKLKVNLPNDGAGEAYLTALHARYTFWGRNWAYKEYIEEVPTFLTGSSQTSLWEVDLGAITNHGMFHRYQWNAVPVGSRLMNYPDTNDDVLQVSFDVQLTQHKDNRGGASRAFTVDLEYTDGTTTHTAASQVTGTVNTVIVAAEDPQISMNWTREEYLPQDKSPGSTVTLTLYVNHTWESTAHAFDLKIKLYVSQYLVYQSTTGHAHTAPTVVTTTTDGQNVVSIDYTKFLFSDNETLTVTFQIDNSDAVLKSNEENPTAQILAQVVYKEADMANLAGYPALIGAFSTPMERIEVPFHIPNCLVAVGVEDSATINDCQLLASSSHKDHPVLNARLNSAGFWSPHPRGAPYYRDEWVQVSLGNMYRITGVTIQAADATNYVKDFELKHSLEGLNWQFYEEAPASPKLFSGVMASDPWGADDTIYFPVKPNLDTRYVRILPKANNVTNLLTGLRFELHGCALTADRVVADVCARKYKGPLETQAERGFLVTDAADLYICIMSNLNYDSVCSYTTDFGQSWNRVDERISLVEFHYKVEDALYGISADSELTHLKSDDGGETWTAIPQAEYDDVKSQTADIVMFSPLSWDDVYDTSKTLGLGSWDQIVGSFGHLVNSTHKIAFDFNQIAMYKDSAWTAFSFWGSENWAAIF